jgi:hypothetical protein
MQDRISLEELIGPLSECLDVESAGRVAEFQFGPEIQARMALLAERANEGQLTGEERAEYETVVRVADWITLLKARARRKLKAGAAV